MLKNRSDFVPYSDDVSGVKYYIAQIDIAHYLLISEQVVESKPDPVKQVIPKTGLFSRSISSSVIKPNLS